jgi:hypothetical protein
MSARLDEIIWPNYCFKRSPDASLLYMTDGKKDLYASLLVSCEKGIIYNIPFWNFIVIMTSMITCLGLLSRHLQSLWALKGSTTLCKRLFRAMYCNCEIFAKYDIYSICHSTARNSENKKSHNVNTLDKLYFTHKTDKVPSMWCLTSHPQ